jgi:type 1 glutamine amidotransferase/glucose/arabinose dehydrogenase
MRWFVLLALLVAWSPTASGEEASPAEPRKIVLIAGKKSHGPGAHDYERTMRLFKVMLDNSNVADRVRVEVHENGWPEDESTLDDADTIVFYSDGRDGDLYSDVPFVLGERPHVLQKQMERGCGLMTMHFSTFVDDRQGEQVLEWVGGYFDWQDDEGKRNWHSKISQVETLEIATREHAISRGVPRMLAVRDEVYWNLRFKPDDKRLTQIVRALGVDRKVDEASPTVDTVGWAVEREDGGRGFGTSVGHAYRLWQDEGVRRLFLNAIVWTARAEVPEGGVGAAFYTDEQVNAALAGKQGAERAIVEPPLRVLLFAGNEAHAWHNWKASTPAVVAALEADPRVEVEVSNDIEDLSRKKLADYSTLVLNNYCNWQDPAGLSEKSKESLLTFLKAGGGLVVIHFANGAFHYSLPEAGESDWPEYRQIVRRVWDHQGKGDQQSSHDAFGRFAVEVAKVEHPVTAGLKPFEVTDELYFHQAGEAPIEPLLYATSQVTKKPEPLAWGYEYEKARVFQTLLGHSEQTYDTFEPREMLRRAVAWTARREVRHMSPEEEQLPAAKLNLEFVEGRFGKALNAARGGVLLSTKPDAASLPLTVECWTKLNSKQGFNILIASEEKSASTHWELYSYTGSGVLSVYMPGRGGEFKSAVDICDGQWHHVGFSLDAEAIKLYVDGKLVGEQKIKPLDAQPDRGEIGIGRLVEGTIGCDGLIDDVRLRSGVPALDAIPREALQRDDATRLLLSLDEANELTPYLPRPVKAAAAVMPAESGPKNAAVPRPTVSSSKGAHWGLEGIGFDWKEEDSRDDRWKDAEIGPFLASSLPLGSAAGTVAKGLSIRLGEKQEATVCYDTASMKLRAAWSGDFLRFTSARYGLISPPMIAGEPRFLSGEGPGWEAKKIQYRGLHLSGNQVVLEYEVDGVLALESPWAESHGEQLYFVRRFEVGACDRPLVARLYEALEGDGQLTFRLLEGGVTAVEFADGRTLLFALRGAGAELLTRDEQRLDVALSPRQKPLRFDLVMWSGQRDQVAAAAAAMPGKVAVRSLVALRKPGAGRWNEEIVTQGKVAADDEPYVVDTLTIPFDNPYRALFFTSGHDFLDPGTVAVCTVHGDVWLVSGVDDSLQRLTWKRFATGLFQPLGLVVREGQIYVLGRDQITRLRDSNGDGEADHYECFTNEMPTSPGGHDYTACLETDSAGNFYFLTANEGIWRLSPDGQNLEIIAGGLRNPNGLGVGQPPGAREPVITAAPQEGNWTPGSYIAEARRGDYFGFGGPRVTPERPLGWTQPLCFIPRRRDNSSGGQVWASGDRWGPLTGQMFHLSYGQCRMMLVLREVIGGQSQGGTVDMSPLFESGAMRGRFSPHDGQLYVTGLRGWTTSATADGCLQRVRYTGRPAHMPIEFRTLQNGVAIRFAEPLHRESAEDLGNYHLEQWNYRYAESYGSPDFKVSDAKQEGHDEVRPRSATLLADGRTLFLEIDDLKPVNQLSIGYALIGEDGTEFRHTIAYTIHNLREERLDPSLLRRQEMAGRLSEEVEASLQRGLIARFQQGETTDARVSRLAAFYVSPDEPASLLLKPGEFSAELEGYLRVPLKGEYRLSVEGSGAVELSVNGVTLLKATGNLAEASPGSVSLQGGYNELKIAYASAAKDSAQLRLFWETDGMPRGPVPPQALFHSSLDPSVREGQLLREGASLVQSQKCDRCHATLNPERSAGQAGRPLTFAGDDLRSDWIAQWLLSPEKAAGRWQIGCNDFDVANNDDRQTAADIAAWLGMKKGTKTERRSGVKLSEPSDELAQRGAELWENLNCIACHRLGAPDESDELRRSSLNHVAAKYTPEGLMRLLTNPPGRPHADFAPSHSAAYLELADDEASALHQHLLAAANGKVERIKELAGVEAERGAAAFHRKCVQCHSMVPPDVPILANGLSDATGDRPLRADRGCLAEEPAKRGEAPHSRWTDRERAVLRQWLAYAGSIREVGSSIEESQRLVEQLNCQACHNRDGLVGHRLSILVEESESGLTPELLPDLTWAGEKLQTSAIASILKGNHARDASERSLPPARAWLKSRMPAFHEHAEAIARGLAAEHGLAPVDEPRPAPSPELSRIGEQLALKEHLDCRQCHGIGELAPTGDDKTKLAPGINFDHIRDRLRHDYYRRFTLDPPRWDVSTRMPKLAADGRTTKVTEHFDGDAEQQFESIWHYLQSRRWSATTDK